MATHEAIIHDSATMSSKAATISSDLKEEEQQPKTTVLTVKGWVYHSTGAAGYTRC